jgi:hypothetical protein
MIFDVKSAYDASFFKQSATNHHMYTNDVIYDSVVAIPRKRTVSEDWDIRYVYNPVLNFSIRPPSCDSGETY